MDNKARPHLWTVISIALVVYAMSSVIHEGIGHGGACLLTGGRPQVMSSVHFECGNENKWVAAGGTLANLLFGILFWASARAVTRSAHWRYFFWLAMTINLLQAGGYFLYSGVGNIGDWAVVIAGLRPAWVWRMTLIMAGALTYFLFVWLALRELRPLLPAQGDDRYIRAKELMLWPYIFGGIQSCIAGAFNPVGMILIAISAAAASFGGTSGLAWMWRLYREDGFPTPAPSLQLPVITKSIGWIFAAVFVTEAFIAILGPGLRFAHFLNHVYPSSN